MAVNGIVGDYCVPLSAYPHVPETARLRDVFEALRDYRGSAEHFRNVLVLDSRGRLVGLLGLRELLHAMLPDFLKTPAPTHFHGAVDDVASLAALWQEDCADHCRQAALAVVRDHVSPASATVAPGDPLIKAVYLFTHGGANALPVVEGGHVVGVLRLVDVFAEVSQAVLDG